MELLNMFIILFTFMAKMIKGTEIAVEGPTVYSIRAGQWIEIARGHSQMSGNIHPGSYTSAPD